MPFPLHWLPLVGYILTMQNTNGQSLSPAGCVKFTIQAVYGTAPVFTYTVSGFVSSDNASVLRGAPNITSTATTSSAPGTYPISIAQGGLFAQNYTFNFVGGTLTVTTAPQTINFPALANVAFGTSQPVALQATATSGLPVVYAVTGPVQLNGGVLQGFNGGVGVVTVTATQAGNQNYAGAPSVAQTFNVVAGVLPISANNVTRPYDADNPTFTYQVGTTGSAIPANEYSGTPLLTTSADAIRTATFSRVFR